MTGTISMPQAGASHPNPSRAQENVALRDTLVSLGELKRRYDTRFAAHEEELVRAASRAAQS